MTKKNKGATDASRKHVEKVLKSEYVNLDGKKVKQSGFLWTGGTRELFTTDPDSMDTKLVINDRKGKICTHTRTHANHKL